MLQPYPNIGIVLILALSTSVVLSEDTSVIHKQKLFANADAILFRHDPQNVDNGFASWASIGYVNDVSENRERSHVVIDFFPVQFCQAVRVCITASQSFTSRDKFMIYEKYCDEYINYYPPTGAFEAKFDRKKTNGYISIFKLTASSGVRKLMYSNKPYWVKRLYEEKNELEVQLSGKMLLILTNSRQCHSRVRVDGKISILDVIQPSGLDKTQLPEVFNYVDTLTKTKTIYIGTGSESTRNADFLHHLRALKTQKFKIGQRKFKCEFGGLGSAKTSIIPKTSVIEIEKKISNNQPGQMKTERKISFDVTDCHWIRLWFADSNTPWSKYETDFKPENAIDFLFSEGFILLPDRENAVPLSLSSDAVRTVTLRLHDDDLIELLLGPVESPYPIVFKSPILKKPDATIFMIRSRYCDASFTNNAIGRMVSTTKDKFNKILIGKCKAYSIEKTP